MVQYVITPWRQQSELLAVREALYGEEREVMAEGVERVGVWSKLLSFLLFRLRGLGRVEWVEMVGFTFFSFMVVMLSSGGGA